MMRPEEEIRQILVDAMKDNAQHAIRCGTSPNYPDYTRGYVDALKEVLSDPEPKPIESLPVIDSYGDPGPHTRKINELIDAVNEMRRK